MSTQGKVEPGKGSSLNSLYGGLSDFSSLLTNALGTIDSNVSNLQTSSVTNHEEIESLRNQVDSFGTKLKNLEAEAEEQRAKLEKAMLNVSDMGKNIDTQLSETTKQMHRELLTQRTATKMDLFTLGGNIRKSMNDAMELISESPKLLKSAGSASYNPNSSNEEGIQFLLEKIKVIEEALMIQHNVNKQLSESVNNDEVVRKVYDSLYDQISNLEISLQQANMKNQELRDRSRRDIDKMKEAQSLQQEQISQLVEALKSMKSMKRFKHTQARNADTEVVDDISLRSTVPRSENVSESKKESEGSGTADDGAYSAIAEGQVSGEEEGNNDKQQHRRGSGDGVKRRQRHRHRHSGSDSEGDGGEDGDDQFDENGDVVHATVKTRHHHRHHRTHHKSDESSIQLQALAPEPQAVAPEELKSESTSGKRNRMTEIKRNKTFSSASSKSEKHTQTAKVNATSTGTSTDPPIVSTPPLVSPAVAVPSTTASASTVVSADATLPKQADGKVIFDDEGSLGAFEQKDDLQYGDPVTGSRKHLSSSDSVSLDESYSYYDSDSYYSVSIRGGVTNEQLEKVAADAKQQVEELRSEYERRTGDLEESVLTFKRISLMLEDMKINYDKLKARVDAASGGGGGAIVGGAAGGNFDEMKATSQYHSIQNAKALWTKVHSELVHGLEKFTESDPDTDPDGDDNSTPVNLPEEKKNSRAFVKKASALVSYLDANLAAFHPAESIAATFKTVHPTLENIYKQAMDLDALDETIKQLNPAEGCSFDALPCSDQSNNLKNYLKEAMSASVPVLDESIPKVAMKQRLEQLERLVRDKVDRSSFKTAHDEMKNIAKYKVDVKEFQAALGKFATAAELAKLNMYVADIGGRGSGVGYSNMRADGGEVNVEAMELSKNPEFKSLISRFDVLGKQQLDLHNYCRSYVPREEVHEAMKSIVDEVKALKQNSVKYTLFKDELNNKADVAEVEKILKTISSAVGDLNFTGDSAGIHAKCLMCDKPVTTLGGPRARTANTTAGIQKNRLAVSASMPMFGYTKNMDDSSVNSVEHDRQMFNRLTSNNPAISQPERAKVTAELAIMRSSIDPLPEINDPSSVNQQGDHGNGNGNYKQRIRHSAGGGVGPTYKKDTR